MTKPKLLPQQIEALYESHGPAVRRFLLGVLKDADLAEEALQQTFIQVMEHGHTARTESMKPWIFKVAFNEAIALRRRAKTRADAMRELALDPRLSHAIQATGDQVIGAEDLMIAQDAVARLPEAQREVVHLRFRESMTFAQISESLEIPMGTTLTRMRLALSKLREMLK